MMRLQIRSASASVAELVHEGLMEGLEAWDHRVDLVLPGEDRAPDVACPSDPATFRALVPSRKICNEVNATKVRSHQLYQVNKMICTRHKFSPTLISLQRYKV